MDYFKNKKKGEAKSKNDGYPVMRLDEIKKLPIGDIASDKAHCFLWTIDKYFFEAKSVLETWSFNYHCTFAWNKTNGIFLYGINRRVEFVLVGLKGKHEAYPKRKTIVSQFNHYMEARRIKMAWNEHDAFQSQFKDFNPKQCSICKTRITKKTTHICHRCKRKLCESCAYSYVDGNNRAITKNSPNYCSRCYEIIYNNPYNKPLHSDGQGRAA